MKIKSIRNPNNEEKGNLIPILICLGISFALVTLIIYLINFNREIGENLYIKATSFPNKSISQHNIIIELFEKIYHRNYMQSKLEGLGISALISLVASIGIGVPGAYVINKKIDGESK